MYWDIIFLGLIVKILCVLAVWADAKADAWIDVTGFRSHNFEFLEKVFLGLVILLVWNYYIPLGAVLSYLFFRMGLFNWIYNHHTKQDPYHLGSGELYDKFLLKLLTVQKNIRIPLLWIWYLLMISIGIFLDYIIY
jgi:hypothetical protein